MLFLKFISIASANLFIIWWLIFVAKEEKKERKKEKKERLSAEITTMIGLA